MDHPTPDDEQTARTEVADRLIAIGALGAHVAAGDIVPADGVDLAQDLLHMARTWVL